MKSIKIIIGSALAAGAAVATFAAFAHHSTTMFDHAKTLQITGVVEQLHWTNPHVAVIIKGKEAGSAEETTWLMEMTSPGNLIRAGGWSRNAVKPGDKVVVDFSPLRDGKKGGALKKLVKTDTGDVFTANIRAQEAANLE
jgi:hypothetical protein